MNAVGTRPQALTATQGDWWRQGACKDEDPNLFFAAAGEDQERHRVRAREALAVCDRCPVRKECLAWALAHEEHGVWGGKDFDKKPKRSHGVKKVQSKALPAEFRCSRCGDIFEASPGPRIGLCMKCAVEVAPSPSRVSRSRASAFEEVSWARVCDDCPFRVCWNKPCLQGKVGDEVGPAQLATAGPRARPPDQQGSR